MGVASVNIVELQASNQIDTLEGLTHLTQLTTLHLRENRLKSLSGLSENMSALQYINLRSVHLSITLY